MRKKGNEYELFYRYDADERLCLVIKNRISDNYKWYYYVITNAQGDVIEIHNGAGAVTAKYNYDSWGKLISITDANGNSLSTSSFAYQISVRYRGYVYDTETGLYYLQSRYYNPETGRFINCDDVDYIGINDTFTSWNAFAYCENDPVNKMDLSGYSSSSSNMTPEKLLSILIRLKPYIKIIANTDFKDVQYVETSNPPNHKNFTPPKGGNKKVKNPNGNGKGWLAKDGGVWVWTPRMHGGEGWTVQYPNGKHKHAYKGGGMREHYVKEPMSKSEKLLRGTLTGVGVILLLDNTTVIGVADDAIAFACFALVPKYTKKTCTVCGGVIYEF